MTEEEKMETGEETVDTAKEREEREAVVKDILENMMNEAADAEGADAEEKPEAEMTKAEKKAAKKKAKEDKKADVYKEQIEQ